MLKDKNPDGKFTFQIILLDNGDIVFVYKDIPFSIDTIPDKSHPVKVGISDAYVIDKTVFCKNEFYLVFHVLFFDFCSHSKEDYLWIPPSWSQKLSNLKQHSYLFQIFTK